MKKYRTLHSILAFLLITTIFIGQGSCSSETGNAEKHTEYISYSGIYPHLAFYNDEDECGTGAVVPWAGRLWVITYGPHLPHGSSDKLYEITTDLDQVIRPESIGGTPANRMIHKESKQLFIGPYAIDSNRNVRVIPYTQMPGRHTGNARHLSEPTQKIYYATMEEGFYEVDVHSLDVKTIYPDGSVEMNSDTSRTHALLPGVHGKGVYSGQGVLVYSNNGEAGSKALERFDIESGSLHEWNGKDWEMVRRNQFVEVTGPGGIYGNQHPDTDPIWVTGWDHKSAFIGVRDLGNWSFYRLPKASHSYDGAHGWNTEWPRIRNIGSEKKSEYLMTMHGMFWHFPENFSSSNTAGIYPRSAYLKVIGDFSRWKDKLVFGCDDAAKKEFLNSRSAKGGISGPGQSNSNLWFTALTQPDQLGPATSEGAVWISDSIKKNQVSDPFIFAGWEIRSSWVFNEGDQRTTFTFEVDKTGDNTWEALQSVNVEAGEAVNVAFTDQQTGEWIRIFTDQPTTATVHFYYVEKESRSRVPDNIFSGLSEAEEASSSAGLLWALSNNRRSLGILAGTVTDEGFNESGYYELNEKMNLVRKENSEISVFMRNNLAIPKDIVSIDDASVLIVDDKGRRWRLPKGDTIYNGLVEKGLSRICREVATERDLFNCSGTFYELPAENADGYAKIRPIASHSFRIYDYASYRGMLILTGLSHDLPLDNEHIIRSSDGKAALWAGVIDDLWKLGKPTGEGGPWKNTYVKAGEASDPYLIGFYDNRSLSISHQSNETVTFRIEVDPTGQGPWMLFREVRVQPGENFRYTFPDSIQSRWIRFISNKECEATAWLKYI